MLSCMKNLSFVEVILKDGELYTLDDCLVLASPLESFGVTSHNGDSVRGLVERHSLREGYEGHLAYLLGDPCLVGGQFESVTPVTLYEDVKRPFLPKAYLLLKNLL